VKGDHHVEGFVQTCVDVARGAGHPMTNDQLLITNPGKGYFTLKAATYLPFCKSKPRAEGRIACERVG
jgi:hypothetical protein